MHAARRFLAARRPAAAAAATAAGAVAGLAAATASSDAPNPFSSGGDVSSAGQQQPARGWSWPDPTTFAFPPKERPVRLFDGHSFAGWSGKIGRYWTIENGAVITQAILREGYPSPSLTDCASTDQGDHVAVRRAARLHVPLQRQQAPQLPAAIRDSHA